MDIDVPAQRQRHIEWATAVAVGVMSAFFAISDEPRPVPVALFALGVGVVGWSFARRHPDRASRWMRRRDGQLSTMRYALFVVASMITLYAFVNGIDGVERWVATGSS